MTGGTADCAICEDEQRDRGEVEWWFRSFMICNDCGNKRCPRATWHANPCSGSNDSGQVGSYYGVGPYKLPSKPLAAQLAPPTLTTHETGADARRESLQ